MNDFVDPYEPIVRVILDGIRTFSREYGAPQKSTAPPSDSSVTRIIHTLNRAGILVSIDYEVDGTYSVSMLRKTFGDNCWSASFLARSTHNLTETLTTGADELSISLE